MNLFDFEDYRKFILAKIDSLPNHGKGELTRIASLLGVNSSFLSQVLHGPKNFSHEQAFLLGEHFGLTELESRYFNELINLERASKPKFKDFVRKQLARIRNEARTKAGMPPLDQPLDERNQATFYSSWYYSGIQLLTGISEFQTGAAISERFSLSPEIVKQVLKFLVDSGLCISDGERFKIGPRRTHLDHNSPLRSRHHMNWRIKAMEKMPKNADDEFFFSGPMRIDQATYEKITELLHSVVKDVNKNIDEARDEQLACLNIDWFKF